MSRDVADIRGVLTDKLDATELSRLTLGRLLLESECQKIVIGKDSEVPAYNYVNEVSDRQEDRRQPGS